MSKTRNLVLLGALGVASVFAARAAWFAARDLRRYNRMREMSGQGPLSRELPAMAREVFANERASAPNFGALIASLPKDAARYLKMRAM
jgi:hypothetical protein